MAAPGRIKGIGMSKQPDSTDDGPRSPRRQPLLKRLLSQPHQFEFFHAVRVLDEWLHHHRSGEGSRKSLRISQSTPSRKSLIRFRSAVTLDFPNGAIVRITESQPESEEALATPANSAEEKIEVQLTNFGLLGSSGVLPRHYTDLVITRFRQFRDRTLQNFLDIFVHRFTVLLCRAWAKYRGHIQYEDQRINRPLKKADSCKYEDSDPLTKSLASLTGLNTAGLAQRLAIPDEAILYHAANLLHCPRTAEALEKMIADVFSVPISVLPFCGGWLSLDPTDRTKLPSSEYPQGNHAVLGESAVIGSRVWDTSSAFEVQLGPLPAVQFKRLLPGQPQLRAIEDLLRFSVGPQYTINIRLILAGTELASCQLCEPAASSQVEPRLGWSCWLPTSAGANMDRCDTVFESAQ